MFKSLTQLQSDTQFTSPFPFCLLLVSARWELACAGTLSKYISENWSDLESLRDDLSVLAATRLELTQKYGGYSEEVKLYLEQLMEDQRLKLVRTFDGQRTRLDQLCSEHSMSREADDDLHWVFQIVDEHLKELQKSAPKHLRPAGGPYRYAFSSFGRPGTSTVDYTISWQHRE